MSKALIIGIILVLTVIAGGYFLIFQTPPTPPVISTPTAISTPSISSNQPTLTSPQPESIITGPLVIRGYVPKNWTFEGQFRMKLLDDKRKLIIQDRVPVEWDAENQKDALYFVESYNYHTTSKSGYLVLENDNPSGLPENHKSTETPIYFNSPPQGTVYLFLYSPEEDIKISTSVACQVVLPEPVIIGLSKTPIKDTLNLLAKKMHPDFFVKSLNLKNGTLTIEFPDIYGFTTGGSCAQGINSAEVVKTALQFPGVKQVKITPDSIFQP